MERLYATFNALRRRHRKALIPFIMGGHPSLSLTGPLLVALQEVGADLIEVGIPFSDPLADGPVIQAASAQALANGIHPAHVLQAIASVRHRLHVPVACLSYWNPILRYGSNESSGSPQAFVKAAAASGIAGLIVPDLPLEEGEQLRRIAATHDLATIFLAAPTSSPARLRAIARASQGFIYYVSVTGTTGMRRSLPTDLAHGVRQLKLLTTKPVCVGFGISTPTQARAVARLADGVIVGSALIRRLTAGGSHRTAVLQRAQTFIRQLKRAIT